MNNHTPDIPPLSEFHHHHPLQIRFNDIDILGHVNNTVYLSFFDTGKAHYFSDVRKGNINWQKVDTVIANVNCSYLRPIFFGDRIDVYTRCIAIGEKSFRLQQLIADSSKEIIYSICETVMVSFDPESSEARPVPADWREALCRYEGRDINNNTIKE